MNGFEFQAFYDTGMVPERFWPEEEAKLGDKYARGDITIEEFEHSLEAMMGFPA